MRRSHEVTQYLAPTRSKPRLVFRRACSAGLTFHLPLPSSVPVTRNVRMAYVGDRPVEVMDTVSHGEVVSHRFEIHM
jgi:hypothetical protein